MTEPGAPQEQEQEQENHLRAWQEAFTLDRWFVIARGWGDQVTPYAVESEDQGVITVFTTPERAQAFGLASGLEAEEAGFLMALPRESAVAYLVQFAEDGIHAVVLDPGVSDSAVVLAALPHVEQLALREIEGAESRLHEGGEDPGGGERGRSPGTGPDQG